MTTSSFDALVIHACRRIEREDPPPALTELAAQTGVSPSHFQRRFKAILGLSPKAYAQACRARRMEFELAVSSSITEAILSSGFGSSSRFYEKSNLRLGMPATSWKAGGKGETIVFALGKCRLGTLLVAATPKGLCAIWLGDDPDTLMAELSSRFHLAQLVQGVSEFQDVVVQVAGLIEQASPGCGFPLDIRGTVFQERIWRTLSQIPPGQTVSYSELARLAEVPQAVRAVANACGANTLAYVIPCHRVVRTGSELGGYRWGVERKQWLLDQEQGSASV